MTQPTFVCSLTVTCVTGTNIDTRIPNEDLPGVRRLDGRSVYLFTYLHTYIPIGSYLCARYPIYGLHTNIIQNNELIHYTYPL
ncbi:hypothetical protein BDQ94DRAFT_131429 [Aspergillus welwitschiae]|uniref:Uncharacterized protein n=1 Tax=Aspergillus welwitschiae TaxID=1341132 RepID=A0A3F3PIJ3_9EURO|nr:hypothetical protein BDQ94DRAFT_131429 [Aspergillus welwitschiae]RDH26687.1 hypothetical protein BDQ94DRAFT_131429 [Aspergillus welwitschiae]